MKLNSITVPRRLECIGPIILQVTRVSPTPERPYPLAVPPAKTRAGSQFGAASRLAPEDGCTAFIEVLLRGIALD
jgi:hypothetical protein